MMGALRTSRRHAAQQMGILTNKESEVSSREGYHTFLERLVEVVGCEKFHSGRTIRSLMSFDRLTFGEESAEK